MGLQAIRRARGSWISQGYRDYRYDCVWSEPQTWFYELRALVINIDCASFPKALDFGNFQRRHL